MPRRRPKLHLSTRLYRLAFWLILAWGAWEFVLPVVSRIAR